MNAPGGSGSSLSETTYKMKAHKEDNCYLALRLNYTRLLNECIVQ